MYNRHPDLHPAAQDLDRRLGGHPKALHSEDLGLWDLSFGQGQLAGRHQSQQVGLTLDRRAGDHPKALHPEDLGLWDLSFGQGQLVGRHQSQQAGLTLDRRPGGRHKAIRPGVQLVGHHHHEHQGNFYRAYLDDVMQKNERNS